MKDIEFKATKHPYYCEIENYRAEPNSSKPAFFEYETWDDFVKNFCGGGTASLDADMNLVFRFDIENIPFKKEKKLKLFFMMQRKGDYRCVIIDKITESDMHAITIFLGRMKAKIDELWDGVEPERV